MAILAKKLIVILDFGHGGSDSGAVANGVIEKVANYNTGMALKAKLEKLGIKVFLTRTNDNTVSLEARTNYANKIAKQYPDHKVIFISVHHNAGGGDRGEYIHTIFGGDSKLIAEAIGEALNKELGQQKKIYSKKSSSGNKDYYHVIRATSMPAVIVEVAFLDNKKDVQICDTVQEQKRNGEVIAKGILNWAGIKDTSQNSNSSTSSESVKKGDTVQVTGSKWATGQTIPDWVKKEKYRVKEIKDNKALLEGVNSWAYTKDLKKVTTKTLKVGTIVQVTGNKWATGQTIPDWVKKEKYKVKEIKDNKALLEGVNSWAYTKDLKY